MNNSIKIRPKTIFSIAAIYTLANFFILLNRGAWWDGLLIKVLLDEHNLSGVWIHLAQFRSYALFFLIQTIASLGGNTIFFVKLTAFIAWILAAIILYVILRKVVNFSDSHSFFLAVFFVLFPTFPFKGELAYLHFSLGVTCFFAGVLIYFMSKSWNSYPKYAGYILSIILFFGSFWNQAILVFYGGFLLLDLYKFKKQYYSESDKPLSFFGKWIKKSAFFIVLPILFWIFHLSLGGGYGIAEGYTRLLIFDLDYLRPVIDYAWSFIAYGFFWPFVTSVGILQRRIFVIILLAFLTVVYLLSKKIFAAQEAGAADIGELKIKPVQLISAGLLWFFLGAFPYLAVGLYPTIFGFGFYQRYAILLPLGSSLITLGFILLLFKEKWQKAIKIIIITLFATYNIFNHFMLDMDWYRQIAIVEALKETKNELIRDASALVFHDDYGEMRYMGRIIKTSEYIVYLREAYPNKIKTAFAAGVGDDGPNETVPEAVGRHYLRFASYGAFSYPADFDASARIVDVTVISNSKTENMTVRNWLALKKSEILLDREGFAKKLIETVKIDVVPIVPMKILD